MITLNVQSVAWPALATLGALIPFLGFLTKVVGDPSTVRDEVDRQLDTLRIRRAQATVDLYHSTDQSLGTVGAMNRADPPSYVRQYWQDVETAGQIERQLERHHREYRRRYRAFKSLAIGGVLIIAVLFGVPASEPLLGAGGLFIGGAAALNILKANEHRDHIIDMRDRPVMRGET